VLVLREEGYPGMNWPQAVCGNAGQIRGQSHARRRAAALIAY